jgi:hypothetical protein
MVHSLETFRGLRGHSHDFQGVKFRRLQVRQNLLDCPAKRLLFVKTEQGRSNSPGRQEKVQPASWIFPPNPYPSRSLTNLQPGAQGSLSIRRTSGKSVLSLIRMVPVLMASGIWALLGVYIGILFGSSWRRRLNVSVGLNDRDRAVAFSSL